MLLKLVDFAKTKSVIPLVEVKSASPPPSTGWTSDLEVWEKEEAKMEAEKRERELRRKRVTDSWDLIDPPPVGDVVMMQPASQTEVATKANAEIAQLNFDRFIDSVISMWLPILLISLAMWLYIDCVQRVSLARKGFMPVRDILLYQTPPDASALDQFAGSLINAACVLAVFVSFTVIFIIFYQFHNRTVCLVVCFFRSSSVNFVASFLSGLVMADSIHCWCSFGVSLWLYFLVCCFVVSLGRYGV